jgi:diguanylate cyclase (GGDEF)-like protein/PAS domain S-box-containing protein
MMNLFLRLNLTQKFIVFLILISILPMLVVGITSYRVSRKVLLEDASNYMLELVDNQSDYLDLVVKQAEDLILNISGVETIIESLDDQHAPEKGYASLATQARIGYILNNYSSMEGLVSIDIFTLGGAHYHVGDTLDVSSIRLDLEEKIYQEAQQGPRRTVWIGIEDNVNSNSSFRKVITGATILTRTDLTTLLPKPVGLLLVNYSPDYLYDHFAQINLGEGAYMMVIDAKSRIIYHPDKNLHGALVSPEFVHEMTTGKGLFVARSGGQETIVTYKRSELSGWTVLSLTPVNTLLAGTVPIGQTTLEVLSLSFLTVILSSFIVEMAVVKPVREITRRFRLFQEGTLDLKDRLPVGKQRDEISGLVRWFNTFLETMQARQKAETDLVESRERYSLALQGSNDGIWDWDLRTNTVHYSTRWKEMLGFSEDSALGDPQDWLGKAHPDDAQRIQDEIAAHLNGSTPHFESEHRLLMQDGTTYRWFQARGLAVRDPAVPAAPQAESQPTGDDDAGEASPAQKPRPHRMAGSLTDITARKEIEERLVYDAMHDPLTHLYNRVFFITQLRHTIESTRRRRFYHAAVLFLDMDRFKIVNDSMGHVVGDQLLVTIGQRLNVCLRSIDTIARFGGDEFVILIDDIEGVHQATQVANRLQEKLAEPFKMQGQDIFMTVSIGIAIIAGQYQQPEEVLRDADTAMYRAKAKGRAGYELFGPEMHDHNVALLHLEADLRRAIERQEFLLHYQPIFSLQTGAVTGVEALLRWQHPERGLISPGAFIDLAEDTGMIIPIGEWVLETACAQLKILHRSGFPGLHVHVNVSARQIQSPRLPELVRSLVQDPEIGGSLGLEITENMVMADVVQTTQSLAALKAMGVSISIDDFGTIYSSLGYLKRLPVDCIKIDRAFVQECAVSTDDAAITTAIIAMGHILDLHVIAEGVEDQAQLQLLRAQRCDDMQGYLFSRPLPVEALIEKLKSDLPAFQQEHFGSAAIRKVS